MNRFTKCWHPSGGLNDEAFSSSSSGAGILCKDGLLWYRDRTDEHVSNKSNNAILVKDLRSQLASIPNHDTDLTPDEDSSLNHIKVPTSTLFVPHASSMDSHKKTIPSATKLEIKNFLQSFYNLDVQKVRTLNMKGKKKHHGGSLIAKPDYKKAYVTLNKPLPVTSNLYPLTMQY
ncbi:hypothetical protein Lal_00002709 [Lupinus albus]|nr:hypothetical protein Lal_00002709 [Lupinus albus]